MKRISLSNNTNLKKIVLLVTTALFFVCGCAQNENIADQSENQKADPVSLSWYINYSWFATKWGGNVVSDYITEKTGSTIEFITPKGSEDEKLRALMAADNLPDFVTISWENSLVTEMVEKDMVYPLNELAELYAPQFFECADEQVMEWFEEEDGNIYCYPNSTYVPEDYENHDNIGSNQTFLVRKDIYEAIGSPDMTTPEGFMQAVRAAAEMFPQINGKELIPIGAHPFTEQGCDTFDKYLQNFLAVPYEKNGVLYDRFTDSEYIRWLKVFRQMSEEGYLKDDIFVDQRVQMDEKLSEGRYFCMLYQRTDIMDSQKKLYSEDPESIYIAIDGPKNRRRDDHVLQGAGINGWTVTFISRKCENPKAAIEMLSYLMSEEGQKTTYIGVEGITYDIIDGKEVVKPEVQELLNTNREEYDRIYGADNAYWMMQNLVMQLRWRQENSSPFFQMEEWTYPYSHYLGQYEVRFKTGTSAGIADQKIKKLWGSTLPKLLLAENEEEFDSILTQFIKEREEAGYQLVVEESSRQIAENKEKLGLE